MDREELRKWLLENGFRKDGDINGGVWRRHPDVYKILVGHTSFFKEETGGARRVQAFLNKEEELVRCVQCGLDVHPNSRGLQSIYCCARCASLFNQSRREKTVLAKYGVKHAAQAEEIQNKIKKTNLKRYGVEYTLQSDEIKRKGQETSLDRYGGHHMKRAQVKEKTRQTCLRRYGVSNVSQSREIVDAIKKTNLERYGVEWSAQSEEIKSRNRKNRVGASAKLTKEQTDILFDKDRMKQLYEEADHHTVPLMEQLGVSRSTVCRYLAEHGIPVRHNKNSYEEKRIVDFIRSIYHREIITNTRHFTKPLELDIYIPEHNLGIEYNGIYWHTEEFKGKRYHLDKTRLCESRGIQLLHIFSTDDQEIWRSVIKNRLNRCDWRIGARQCDLREVTSKESRIFLDRNHLQGATNSAVRLGLFYKDELVSLMTFNKSRFDVNYTYELIRFCSGLGTQVTGAASRLLVNFRRMYTGNIISYANRRWSDGGLYRKLGFNYLRETTPNFFYTKDFLSLYSRQKFQKHRQEGVLEIFDPDLSAEQNMVNNGYKRIFDCGNLVYGLE